ncbi:hypothetical protein CROQUDRAFT_669721 [Cronartium quercuum f. sp. fusiforme G11]|uniref:Uncharacterized protein n=1 Tax=Cronartium quercuum f. sp. fusiforme G11 TaxID=708437 RepID=A0A9P6TEA8_9BASI|nr:hypothetical protein CROQUDRAFT_675225 [Cronartium quercuum f. sp. fusiforme G11]KAG0148659.1 hypothetical protein CROQUDRAFT_669721 [Cronartium quercuum f. sp. fusiforme G11]
MTRLFGTLAFLSSLVASILLIFVEIGNTDVDQSLSKKVRLVTISTFGLGTAIWSELSGSERRNFRNSDVYGSPNQELNERTLGDGLRYYYTWGLWSQCAGYVSPSHPQYCTSTRFAKPLEPTNVLLEDVPSRYSRILAALLAPGTSGLRSDKYYSDWSKFATYSLFASLVHMIILLPLSAFLATGRAPMLVALVALGMNMPVVMAAWISAAVYTAMVSNLKHKLNGQTLLTANNNRLGLEVEIGNGLGIWWAMNVILLLGVVPYFLAFLSTRQRTQVSKLKSSKTSK